MCQDSNCFSSLTMLGFCLPTDSQLPKQSPRLSGSLAQMSYFHFKRGRRRCQLTSSERCTPAAGQGSSAHSPGDRSLGTIHSSGSQGTNPSQSSTCKTTVCKLAQARETRRTSFLGMRWPPQPSKLLLVIQGIKKKGRPKPNQWSILLVPKRKRFH